MVEVMLEQTTVNVYVFKKFVLRKYLVLQDTDWCNELDRAS
jgi:hypothetical protein